MKSKKVIKRTVWVIVLLFVLLNAIAFMHAYRFTHFDNSASKTQSGDNPSFAKKMRLLFFGIDNPRPENMARPTAPFQTIDLQSNKRLEGWLIERKASLGTVILFHGYGGSEGSQTTIGFFEATQVKTAFRYLERGGETNIILFGTSMGAVAIMKAMHDFKLTPKAIIIECPFGTMLETVQARFRSLRIPSFPMANLLVFWGGIQNNFNAFKHNPVDYANKINCRILLLSGEKDERVSIREIQRIYNNLAGPKVLRTYSLAGHENYLNKYRDEWTEDCRAFLSAGK